jgi:hypothetical protein
MYKNTFLTKHLNKNIFNYIISNYVFKNKKIELGMSVKSYFFYNNYNFYFSIFLLFNFWYNKIKIYLKKTKITIKSQQTNFFVVFSLFIYPSLKNFNTFLKKNKDVFYLTFLITNFFFNPLYILTTKLYLYKQTFLILKLSMFLKKENVFFIFFYLNFFQIPLMLNKDYKQK